MASLKISTQASRSSSSTFTACWPPKPRMLGYITWAEMPAASIICTRSRALCEAG
jgi:hypothetical protein